MRTEFGFEPAYATAAAFDAFRDSPGQCRLQASHLLSAGLGALRG